MAAERVTRRVVRPDRKGLVALEPQTRDTYTVIHTLGPRRRDGPSMGIQSMHASIRQAAFSNPSSHTMLYVYAVHMYGFCTSTCTCTVYTASPRSRLYYAARLLRPYLRSETPPKQPVFSPQSTIHASQLSDTVTALSAERN